MHYVDSRLHKLRTCISEGSYVKLAQVNLFMNTRSHSRIIHCSLREEQTYIVHIIGDHQLLLPTQRKALVGSRARGIRTYFIS